MMHATDELSVLIAAHRSAWDRTLETQARLDEVDGKLYRPPNSLVPGLTYQYDWTLGREEIIRLVRDEYRKCCGDARRALRLAGSPDADIEAAITRLTAKRDACIVEVNAFFDRVEKDKAEWPLTLAERAHKAAEAAETEAWTDLLGLACNTPEEVHAKATYVVMSGRVRRYGFDADDAETFAELAIAA